ncbi:nucleotidyltransferase domain-containing protein [Candidatus Kaiserbacteria bacterium]|nr:nucleotidyltransferase domain-containing protein [Candidatus Kaiserbacteria bacterium]
MELPQEVQAFIDNESHKQDVLGVALFGSWARGDNRPDSDIDLFILTTDREQRAIEKVGMFNIEMVCTSEDLARKFAFKRTDPPMQAWEITHKQFDIEDAVRAARSLMVTDVAAAEMFLQRTVYNLLQFYFDKNQIWAPPPKKQLAWLREHNPTLADKFDAFYTATTLEDKLQLAEGLCKNIA